MGERLDHRLTLLRGAFGSEHPLQSRAPRPSRQLTLGALELALSKSTPEIHHSDQGLQYAATDYTARLQSVGAQISMAEVGQSAPQRLCRASHPNDQGRRSLPERLSRSGGCAGADTRPRL